MTLPVPVSFKLPGDQWSPQQPSSLGVANADFLAVRTAVRTAVHTAVRPGDGSGYRPVLTVSGGLRDEAVTLDVVAGESLEVLRTQAAEVELLHRRRVGDWVGGGVPGITQLLGGTAVVGGRSHELRQGQLLLDLVDIHDPAKRAVLVCTVTCTAEQLPVVGPEFEQFVSTIRVGEDAD